MLERDVQASGLVVYRSWALARLGVPHAFTTRIGRRGRELDLRAPTDEDLEALRTAARAAPDARVVAVRQVHGAVALEVGAEPPPPDAPADALVGGRADRLLLVYSADCVPILLASADGRRVAAVHAGWRGLVGGVVQAALAALGAPAAAAAIGPCLSRERCEMGPEVVERFEHAGLASAVERRSGARDRIDVREAARLVLERAGVASIEASDRCTWRDADEFPSHRRDVTHGGASQAGRIGALVAAATAR